MLGFALLAFCGCMGAQAQSGGSENFSSPEAISQRLQAVRTELESIQADADPSVRESLQELESVLLQHRESVDYLAGMRREVEAARSALRHWNGLEQPPPYSIRFADELRARHQSLQRQEEATETRLRIIQRAIEGTTLRLEEHQSATRRHAEAAATAGSVDARRVARAAQRREELAARIQAESLARLYLRRDAQSAQVDALAAALELAALRIEASRGKVQFTREELDEILLGIDRRRSELLAAARIASGDASRASQQQTWKLEILDMERQFWNQLYRAHESAGTAERAEAVAAIEDVGGRIAEWVELLRLLTRETVLDGAREDAIGASPSVADMEQVLALQARVTFALEELRGEGVHGPTLRDRAKEALLAVWNAELYLAEETESVGGNRVTTVRAVTLGKLLRLAVILVVGWFLLRYLVRRVRRIVERRPGVAPGTADAVAGWTLGLGLALLIIYGLNRVHIPFATFAFLGGTLAIGIGFGAQTLLKNFISGVILSLERPFRVGDVVEVENTLGRIARIGMRASVIRHFDGTDTLVPNSMLLENRVSNWTYSDTTMRDSIVVGVAYGSPTREVARVLLAVAREHGLVLDRPPPEVRFEEFGDNALLFRLFFWFDTEKAQKAELGSDLRFMIDRAFAEAGIVMAFPQRDIHFDDSKPLRVEVTRASQGGGPEEAAQ